MGVASKADEQAGEHSCRLEEVEEGHLGPGWIRQSIPLSLSAYESE